MRISDWSSDVCSSDLPIGVDLVGEGGEQADIVGAVSEAEMPVHLGRAFEQVGEGVPAERESGGKDDRRPDRERVGEGKRAAVRVDCGGRRSMKKHIN